MFSDFNNLIQGTNENMKEVNGLIYTESRFAFE